MSHPGAPIVISFLSFLKKCLFLREIENREEAEREREIQNLKQGPGSELSAQSLMWGLELRDRKVMT